MANVEKVKQGLFRCFMKCNEPFAAGCGQCPYVGMCFPDGERFETSAPLYTETVALIDEMQAEIERLKAHEAKLLTFDEVKKHYSIPDELTGNLMESIDYSYDIAPLYMECPDEDQWVVHWRDYRSIEPFLEDWREAYGKTWRCWTAKPTAEQRSAAKWN